MIRVFPRVDNAKLMELFRKGVEGQWSAAQIDWECPLLLDPHERTALAHVLTPVYLGEQTAMIGASSVIPQFFAAHQTEAHVRLVAAAVGRRRPSRSGDESRNQCMERPLSRRDCVRQPGFEREAKPAIVQREAGSGDDDP